LYLPHRDCLHLARIASTGFEKTSLSMTTNFLFIRFPSEPVADSEKIWNDSGSESKVSSHCEQSDNCFPKLEMLICLIAREDARRVVIRSLTNGKYAIADMNLEAKATALMPTGSPGTRRALDGS